VQKQKSSYLFSDTYMIWFATNIWYFQNDYKTSIIFIAITVFINY